MKQIPYSHQCIDQKDIRAVVKALRSDFLTQGPGVERFEAALCRYTGARYAVAVANGTAALHLACLAAGFSKGDEVIVPANTFVASANSVLYVGARPVFADIDPKTGNIDPDQLSCLVTKRTRAVMGVDYAGQPCAWGKLAALARKRKLVLIDDASHALGAGYEVGGKWFKIGSSGHADMTTFSFHPLKTITTGEGGAILTNRRDLYVRLLRFRNHGVVKNRQDFVKMSGRLSGEKYFSQMIDLGFNYRLTDIQCALGISQLAKTDRFVALRARIDARYRKAFTGNPYLDMLELKEGRSSFHLFPVLLKDPAQRTGLMDHLRERGVGSQVHYMPVYWHPYYQRSGYRGVFAPKAEAFYRREVSLPVHPLLTRAEQDRIIRTILFYGGER